MASPTQCLAAMAKLSLTATRPAVTATLPKFLAPGVSQIRCASKGVNTAKAKILALKEKKKRKLSKEFRSYDPTEFPQFSLCDAMRYLRAYEVGRNPQHIKYELAVRLKTQRNGPTIRGRIRLPHTVKTADIRVGVICPDNSEIAQQALSAGAVIAGETSVFEAVRNGDIKFNRLVCHTSSEAALNKAGLGRILGPKGLMPNKRMKTITDNVLGAIKENAGAENYRERTGALRLPVGQLGFSPKQLSTNIKAFIGSIKDDINQLDGPPKEVSEVVLSTSHGPGFNLNGYYEPTDEKVTPAHLSQIM